MPLFYALIARKQFVIADYNTSVGNAAEVALQVLSKVDDSQTFRQFATSNYKFIVYSKDGFHVLVMADTEYPIHKLAAFLKKIHQEFQGRLSPDIRNQLIVHPQQMPEFRVVLQEWIGKYSDGSQLTKVEQLKQELNEIEKQTRENIDRRIETAKTEEELNRWTKVKEKFSTVMNKPQ